jgi:hypothetical protein
LQSNSLTEGRCEERLKSKDYEFIEVNKTINIKLGFAVAVSPRRETFLPSIHPTARLPD